MPDKTGAKPYALLLSAMTSENKVAIGRVVLRSKEYLTAVRPLGETLTMSTMRFADEIVPRTCSRGCRAPTSRPARRRSRWRAS